MTIRPPSLSRRRKLLYTAAAFSGAGCLMFLAVLCADIYVHWRSQEVAGVNVWGYRGATVGRKQPGEIRIVLLGGSAAFGWGLPAKESIAAFLERRLSADARTAGRRVAVVNLGAPGQGAYGFVLDLADYEYLDYDIVLLYEGYNDLGVTEAAHRAAPNYFRWRRQSPVFRVTGYYPILPLMLREKAVTLLHGGDLNGAYAKRDVVFRPSLAARATAGALQAAAEFSERLGGQIGRLSDTTPEPSVDEQCVPKWKQYCGAVRDAVAWALDRDRQVIFVTQPYTSDTHIEQQANALAMLHAQFGSDRRVRSVNLGTLVDMSDSQVAYDGLHLVARGNDTVAAHLVEPVVEMMR